MPCDEPPQSEGLCKLERLDIKAALVQRAWSSSLIVMCLLNATTYLIAS